MKVDGLVTGAPVTSQSRQLAPGGRTPRPVVVAQAVEERGAPATARGCALHGVGLAQVAAHDAALGWERGGAGAAVGVRVPAAGPPVAAPVGLVSGAVVGTVSDGQAARAVVPDECGAQGGVR
ncbi:hypothetical protein [Georgenia yuyongxinii]